MEEDGRSKATDIPICVYLLQSGKDIYIKLGRSSASGLQEAVRGTSIVSRIDDLVGFPTPLYLTSSVEINNDSFKLYIKDVVYYKENKNKKTFFIQRDRDVKQGVSKKTLGGGNPVIKPIGWSYEKETRLIIEISNPTKEMFDMKYAKISLASTMDENWLNGFYKQIVYSPKCDIGKHEHGVYNNKKVTFKTSVLKDIINWEIR